MLRLPSILLCRDFFSSIWYFNFNLYYTIHKFGSFLKHQILKEFKNIEKINLQFSRFILQKKCIDMFPTLGLSITRQSKTTFPLALKETGGTHNIHGKLAFQHVHSLHYQQLNKIKRSIEKPHRDGFSFFSCLCFSAFLLVYFCLYFLTLNFVLICNLLDCSNFPFSGWRRWNFTSLATRVNQFMALNSIRWWARQKSHFHDEFSILSGSHYTA